VQRNIKIILLAHPGVSGNSKNPTLKKSFSRKLKFRDNHFVKLELKLLKPFTDLVYLIGFKSNDLVKFKKTRVGRGSSGEARKSRVVSFDSTH
jgi:hypothetical protein